MNIRHLCRLGLALVTAGSVAVSTHAATLTRTSAFTYDAASGLLLKEIIEPDTSSLCLVTEYTYDSYGNKTAAATRNCNGSASEAVAPSGDPVFASRTTSNTMDARGQFPTASTNALSQSETKTFNADFGTVASLTGPNGLTTGWTYDSFGRKTLETRADGTKTKWDYLYCTGINGGTASCPTVGGAAGTWVLVTTPLASDGVTQNGPISKTYYDALNREIRSETQGYDGSGTSTPIYKDTQYDSLGRPYKVSRPYYSGQTAYWITVTYDSLGRVIQETQADNTSTSTSYNGLTVTVTNANNQTRTTTKNSQGQVVSVTDAQNKTLTYAYDPFGNLTQTTDALGNIVTLTYDLRGRKTQMQDPDMGTWTYVYDALGQLIRQVDAKNQTSTLTYDKLGRMTNRSEADLISNWYYDTYKGGGACNKGIGKLCQSETSTGYNKTVTYDSLGRSSSTSTTIDVPTPYSASATYDANGRVLTQTYPTGLTVKYVYTSLGYLKEVRDNSSNALYWQANSLDAEGHLLQQTYGNNVQTTQSYNATNGRITAIQAGAGNAVQNLSYVYDNLGNITSRADANQSLTETFVYDTLNRLTSAQVNSSGAGIQTQTFSYDALGNILSKSDVGTYTYLAFGSTGFLPHAVSQVTLNAGGKLTFTYDANGNLSTQTQTDASSNTVAAKSRSQFYTSFNMPTSLGQGTTSAAFYYGPEHQRIKQISSAQGTTIYLNPDNSGGLFYERDIRPDNSVEQRNFITAAGQVIAIVKYTTVSGATTVTTRYMHRDNLSSVTAVTNESGAVIERLAYEPFGKRRFPNGSTDPNSTIMPQNTDRGFTNHEELDEVGLIHMNGRIYDPLIGRFGSADPQVQSPGSLQGYNRYSYAWNNPLLYVDPSGYGNFFSDLVSNPAKAFGLDGAVKSVQNTVRAMLNDPVRAAIVIVAAYYTGQAVGSWLGNSAVAAASSSSTMAASTAFANAVAAEGVGYTLTAAGTATVAASSGFAASYLASGGDFQAGLKGAASGAVFGAVDGYYGNSWGYERLGANAAAGAISAKIYGTDAMGGVAGAFMTAAAKWGYYSQVGFGPNPLPGESRLKTTYDYDVETGRQFPDSIRMNVIGLNNPLTGNFWGDFGKQGSFISKVLNFVPGINATAALHDYWFNKPDHLAFTPFNNVGTMLPAAAMTYGALLNGPLTVQMSEKRK